jgi:NADH-quinone oxidoreductase subunit J
MEIFFFFLTCCCFTCATFVIGIANPIHSILLLILVFFFGSILLLLLNLEFFAFIFLIVYVGAIAVLFLFMVMTLDIKIANVTQKIQDFFSYRSIIILLLLLNILIFFHEDFIFVDIYSTLSLDNFKEPVSNKIPFSPELSDVLSSIDYSKYLKTETHLEVIGKALFLEYKFPFLLCGFILFIAMIGAIVVTVEDFNLKTVKQQDSVLQALRSHENTIFNFKFYKN